MGPNATASGNTFQQIQMRPLDGEALRRLEEELETLRTHLFQRASAPEHQIELGYVAQAQVAARQGDTSSLMKALAHVGRWTLGVAEKLGLEVAKRYIEGDTGS